MKKQSFFIARAFGLIWLVQIFLAFGLSAQQPNHPKEFEPGCRHAHDERTDQAAPPRPSAVVETVEATAASPSVMVTFDQEENGKFLYHTVAGWNGSSAKKAQVSLAIRVNSLEPSLVVWEKVSFTYLQNGTTQTKTYNAGMIPLLPGPNNWKSWQNGRDYHEEGEVLYLDSPLPISLTVKLYFVGYSTPVSFTKPLGAYSKTFDLPFRAFDLAENEVWEGASTHAGGSQVFGYDMAVYGHDGGGWSRTLPGTNGMLNSHHRSWGKPVYAMADGKILESLNNCPNNPAPGSYAEYEGFLNGSGGNHFYIQHGENVALYAHFIKGTLNPQLLTPGATVKAGDFLGLSGNSGRSTAPHLHVSIRKDTVVDSGPGRPLLFNNGWVIEKGSYGSPQSNANWFELTAHGLPGKGHESAFIWPSSIRPKFNDRIYTGVWREGSDNHAMLEGVSAAVLVSSNQAYQVQGLHLSELSVVNDHGNILYSGVWRSLGANVTQLQTGTTYAEFMAQYATLTSQNYRLLDVEVFRDANGALKYAGVYTIGTYNHKLFIGLTWTAFQIKCTELRNQGFRLADVEVYDSGNGSFLYAGVWKNTGVGDSPLITGDWASFTQQWRDLNEDGFRLVDLDTEYLLDGNAFYIGTFVESSVGENPLWQSNFNQFYSRWEHLGKANYRLVDLNVRMKYGAGLTGDQVGDRAGSGDTVENTAGPGKVKISPNPASDQFIIRTETNISDWTLYDALGKIVLQGEAKELRTEVCIPVNTLTNGTYFLAIRTDKGIVAQAVQVLH